MSMSELSEARVNYFFWGNIIKEEFPKALKQALPKLEEWDLGTSFDAVFDATFDIRWSLIADNLRMLREEYRRFNLPQIMPKKFNEFLDQARNAFTALGVSTDSLDATRKFSVVNEFSAVGLKHFIKQSRQRASGNVKVLMFVVSL